MIDSGRGTGRQLTWLVLFFGLTLVGQARSQPAGGGATVGPVSIDLPEMLAIELLAPRMATISPQAPPLRELLGAASAGGLQITHDQSKPLPLGATPVTWTAWEGVPQGSAVRARKTAYVYVFPFGQTPVGLSGDDHATAGNQAAKVVRDASGAIHMSWLDGGRSGRGNRVMYRRAAQDPVTGSVSWEEGPIRVSDAKTEMGNSYVALAASDRAVHFAWVGGTTTRYRRLLRIDNAWRFDPIRDTRATGSSGDNGPAIAVRGEDEIHVLTPSGRYAVSIDGGLRWSLDQVPLLPSAPIRNPALALDAIGNTHVVFTATVRNAKSWSSSKPNAGYWELRYVRRQGGGGWVDAQDVLAAFPEWSDPKNEWDLLADWSNIAVDAKGNVLVAWHGTVNTHIFGNDEAFAIRRPAAAPGSWGAWERPQALHPAKPATGAYFSFAPSLTVDPSGDVAIAVIFFEGRSAGRYTFDTDARILRAGALDGPAIPLSRMAGLGPEETAVSVWFPVAGPRLFRYPDGRAWLDVLQTVVTPETHKAPYYVIYQRQEVTRLLKVSR